MYTLTEEEWECVRVCVANAPIPYDITKKKKQEGLPVVKYDLSPYGIIDNE